MACFSALEVDDGDPVDYVQITGFTVKSEYTTYSIRICVGDITWTVERRYSEFDAYERSRLKGDDSGPVLPPKRLLRNQDPEFLSHRRKELETYLKSVFKLECLKQKAAALASVPHNLAVFLDFHLYEVHAVVENLARRWAAEPLPVDRLELSPLELHAISERFRFAEPSFGCSPDLSYDLGHVAEHIGRVLELKICGSRKIGASNIRQSTLPFDLHYFKSVVCLWISHCDPIQIKNFDALRTQLVKLSVHNTLQRISELVCPDCEYDVPTDVAPWPGLEIADLSFNNLCFIDQAIVAFRYVQYLDLTCNCLTDINCLQHLPFLRELNLSNNRIEKIENWHCKLGNVKKIWLTNNKVQSLKGLSKLYSLEFLDVRDNQLTQVRNVWPIGQLPCLRVVLLTGNGVENGLDWRTRMLEAFGERAAEVKLDGTEPSQRELDTVGVRLAIRKAKEDRRRQLNALTEQLNEQLGLAEAELLRSPTNCDTIPSSQPNPNAHKVRMGGIIPTSDDCK